SPYHSDSQALLPPPREVNQGSPTLSPRRAQLSALDLAHITFKMLLERSTPGSALVPSDILCDTLNEIGVDVRGLCDEYGDKSVAAILLAPQRSICLRQWLLFAEGYPNLVALMASTLGRLSST